ncbi:response regulator [Desulfovibrio mangrovi]|uniref:AAA family ATPase n=1 Tax=Desulfovibrio mangrovi TaxID=2976983 RepID=UPI0022455C14|nr:response regulator [Desulfovibrio mangrovi]UZP65904.1 response regulator [Desulfovibrio mangrovi]
MNAVPIHFRLHHTEAVTSFAKLVKEDARFSVVLPGSAEADKPAGLVIVEVGGTQDVPVIAVLAANPSVREIFVIGPAQNADLILGCMRAGATEYLPLPLKVGEFRAALDRFATRNTRSATERNAGQPQPTRPGRIIHILGGKQGTGVTTIAVNLGVEASQLEDARPAALVDMRQPQGEVPLFLDVHYTHTWAAATHNAHRLDDAFMQSLMVRHASGLDILAAPDRSEDTGAAAPQAVAAMLSIMRSMYSTVFVDGSPFVDEISLAAMREADVVLLVSELSLPCLANTRRLLETLDSVDPEVADKVQLVVNRYTTKAGVTIAEAEELLGRPVVWKIDEDYIAAVNSINMGTPLRDTAPKSPLTRNIAKLAATFSRPATSSSPMKPKSGFMGKLFRASQAEAGTDEQQTPMHILQGAGG